MCIRDRTIQALAAATHLANTEDAKRILVVAPAGVVGNWIQEVEKRTSFDIRTLHGRYRDYETQQWMENGGVAVTSYTTLNMLRAIHSQQVDLLVADEAHYVKNPDAKRTETVASIANSSKRLVLMTGTPLENNSNEFVNLIKTCAPSVALSLIHI